MDPGIKLQSDFVVSPFILASEDKISIKKKIDGKHSDHTMSPKFQPRNNI